MTTSVMVFHPNMANSRINQALMERIRNEQCEDWIVRDMYSQYPDFHIDIAQEQRIADDADLLVFQFPFYWYSAPALMKQWLDDVLSSGWAYGPDATIGGKRMLLAISAGGSTEAYSAQGKHKATVDELVLPYRITAQYLGMKFENPFVIHGAYSPDLTDSKLDQYALQYLKRLK